MPIRKNKVFKIDKVTNSFLSDDDYVNFQLHKKKNCFCATENSCNKLYETTLQPFLDVD